jgi:hypothetical protein
MPARPARSALRALAPFIVAGTLAIAASATVGLEARDSNPIPDSAFAPVTFGSPAPGTAAAPARTPDIRPLRDAWFPAATAPPERARPAVPVARPIVRAIPTPKPDPVPASNEDQTPEPSAKQSISGLASWYCRAGVSPCTYGHPDGSGFNAYAAAGPALREAIGPDWRGRVVTVDGINVKLIDWCQCHQGEANEKLLDLYYDVYKRTGTNVRVRW